MKLILTSLGVVGVRENGIKIDANINMDNGLLDTIKEHLKATHTFVFVSSDPTEYAHNDLSCKLNVEAFRKVGIEFENAIVVDDRNYDKVCTIIPKADLVFLQGGDVVVQNKFFDKIDLSEYLSQSDALVIGQSAGSMNLTKKVYVYPEGDEQLDYPKFIEGMGYVDMSIIPHFNITTGNNFIYEGVDYIQDYFIPDSSIVTLYAILDGTYITLIDNITTIHGECYKIENGTIECVCVKDDTLKIK